ncbi:hypothetical protein J3R83DRAFT_32 [Lanmaoa asiatica]|nr:hypothetical protein J3R83DRAFT_32 [Lanmaoa asiatica]
MWLSATDAYRSWREGKYSFLLLQGKGVPFDDPNGSVTDVNLVTAGAGKSVLASSVVNDLNNTKGSGEFLAFFYCDFRTKRSTSAVGVMRSLLAQLAAHLCAVMMDPEYLLDELLKGADSRVDSFYNVKGLSYYLSEVARLCPRKPFVVVDALDECGEVESLLDGLIMINGDTRMFVTSRPMQNIVQMLSHLPCISMDEMVHELSADILLHVTRELGSRRRLRTFDERLKEEIRSELCIKADGMFRWVQCQIDTLEKCTSVSEIRRVLNSLPEGLEETYRKILIAIDRRLEDSCQVRRGLMWLVTALRPMRLCELLEGLTINPIRRALDPGFTLIKGADFLEVSKSLVIHRKETDIVTLSHMSVKEYLVGELIQEKMPRYHTVLEDAHERVARLCMAYIAFCLEEMKEYRDQSPNVTQERNLMLTSYTSRPLLNYVLSDGFSHLSHLGSGNAGIFTDMETLQVVIRRHAWEWDQMCKSVPLIRSGTSWPSSEHDFTMYTLVAFASDALFHTFLDRPTLTPREGTNPLVYAAHFGKTDHARALIMRGTDVNHRGLVVDKLAADDSDMDDMYVDGPDADDSDLDTSIVDYSNERKAIPIQVAVDHWHAETLGLFLTQGTEFVKWAVTPWDNRRLLEAFVEDEEEYEKMKGGDETTFAIRRLVQVGCAETLLVAVGKGCLPVVRTLLSMITSFPSDIPSASCPYVIVNPLAANGDTPLHIAMRLSGENQCLSITELLVEAGCSPCDLNADDKPPIHVAVV